MFAEASRAVPVCRAGMALALELVLPRRALDVKAQRRCLEVLQGDKMPGIIKKVAIAATSHKKNDSKQNQSDKPKNK